MTGQEWSLIEVAYKYIRHRTFTDVLLNVPTHTLSSSGQKLGTSGNEKSDHMCGSNFVVEFISKKTASITTPRHNISNNINSTNIIIVSSVQHTTTTGTVGPPKTSSD